eukprot:2949974-Pyramimonas_sp.AAC.1
MGVVYKDASLHVLADHLVQPQPDEAASQECSEHGTLTDVMPMSNVAEPLRAEDGGEKRRDGFEFVRAERPRGALNSPPAQGGAPPY